jgi:hypothetical protein
LFSETPYTPQRTLETMTSASFNSVLSVYLCPRVQALPLCRRPSPKKTADTISVTKSKEIFSMSTTGTDGAQDFSAGDRISLTFDDAPGEQITATVRRKTSDIQEGLSPEIEDYVDYFLEITCAGDKGETVRYVASLTTGRYWLDGRYVTIHKL